MLKTHKFARKTFYVDAVRVTEANLEEVAEWCGGELLKDDSGHDYIKVDVSRPLTDRQTMAFLGDWVLGAGSGFKVFTPKAFDKSFEKVRTLTKEQADAAGIKVPHEPRPANEKKQTKKGKNGHGSKPNPPRAGRERPNPKHMPRRKPDNPVLSEENAAKLKALSEDQDAKTEVSTTGAVAEGEVKVNDQIKDVETGEVVAEVPAEIKGKSKADLEAEALIAEIEAINNKPGQ